MNVTHPETVSLPERRSRRPLEHVVPEMVPQAPRKAYSAPKLELLADYGEGGPEPVCLRD